MDEKKIKEQESLLSQKDSEIEALRSKIAQMSGVYTAEKSHHTDERQFTASDMSEYSTRKSL